MFWLARYWSPMRHKRKPVYASVSKAAKVNAPRGSGWGRGHLLVQWQPCRLAPDSGKDCYFWEGEWCQEQEGCMDLLNQVLSENHTARIFVPETLWKSPWNLNPCCLQLSDHSSCSAKDKFSIYCQFSLWYPIWRPGPNLPFLFLKLEFKLGFHHLLFRFLVFLLISV